MNYNNDRTNAPTEVLIRCEREHHRIATLGRNAIIRDHYKTQALTGNERVTRLLPRPTWRQTTAKLIREKTKRLRRLITTALKVR
jgi:hypothetical protein